jgi:hypothetical protein
VHLTCEISTLVNAPIVLDASATTTVLDVCYFSFLVIAPEFLGAYTIMIFFFEEDIGAGCSEPPASF